LNFSKALTGVLISLLAGLFPLSSFADSVNFTHHVEQNRLKIILKWPTAISFSSEVERSKLVSIDAKGKDLMGVLPGGSSGDNTSLQGQKLVLRFERPIEAPGLINLPGEIPNWIENVEMGFDTLLIKTPSPAKFEVFSADDQVMIQIAMAPAVEAKKGGASDPSVDQELRFLQSQLISRKGKFEAQSKLTDLLKQHPNDHAITVSLAEMEERLGRWRQSIELYDQALKLEPGDKDVLVAKSYQQEQFGPQVRIDQFYRDTTNEEVQSVTRATARQTFYQNYLFGVDYEYRDINDNLARPGLDGVSRVFDGNRQQWGVFVERAHDFAHTRVSIVGQEDEPGAALEHRRQIVVGELFLRGVYNEPYWDFLEGITNEGTASRLQARWTFEERNPYIGQYQGQTNFSGSLGVNLNRYGVEDDDDIADSVEVLAEIRYHLNPIFSGLSVGYNLNAEYVKLKSPRLDTTGANFNIIPIQTVQNHSIDVALSHAITNNVRFDLSSGYRYDDRIDSNGPFVFFDLIYDTLKSFEMGVNVEFNEESNRGTDTTFTQVGGFLLWKL
jgi:tetratricopeptide (TPR) repeat protein